MGQLPTLWVASLVAYDGTGFHGFQYQVGAPTVQGELERALNAFAQPQSRVSGAGRTDAGVHARGQVIAVRVAWRHPLEKLQDAWNAHLPATISLRRLVEAPERFHPRFSATARTYRYTVIRAADRRPQRSPLTDRYALLETRPLDLAAMAEAASHLIGEHDFATFGQPTQGESTVRRVTQAQWQVVEPSLPELDRYPGQAWVFTITANGFLRQMVRSLVGTLLAVGRGEVDATAIPALLAARERRLA
ncbi:MAG TPA: tRNA pseudouridine(38-40) synthase TruA, partial [Caldilineaceae bacterium]|nr:tRNA pseudouridine(38-40) synthase TruA [Caldilineaceae bacterium]